MEISLRKAPVPREKICSKMTVHANLEVKGFVKMSITFGEHSTFPETFTIGSLDSFEELDELFASDPFARAISPLTERDPSPVHSITTSWEPIATENLKKRKQATQDDILSVTEATKFQRALPEEGSHPSSLQQTAFVYFSVVKHLSPKSPISHIYKYTQASLDRTYPTSYSKHCPIRSYIYSFVRQKTVKDRLKSYEHYVSTEELEKIKKVCREILPQNPPARPDNLGKTAFIYFSVVGYLSEKSSLSKKYTYTHAALEKIYPGSYTRNSTPHHVSTFIRAQKGLGTHKPYTEYISGEELEKIKTVCREILPQNPPLRPNNLGKTAFIYFSVVDYLVEESSLSKKYTYTHAALEKIYPGSYTRNSISQHVPRFIRVQKTQGIHKPYTEYASTEELSNIETLCRKIIGKYPKTS